MVLFEDYKNHPDESIRERAGNWAIAFGLQRVDGLNVSDFLIQIARQEIEGKITMKEAQSFFLGNDPPNSEESKRIAEYRKARRS